MKYNPEWIIFDLGGVLVNVDFLEPRTRLAKEYHLSLAQVENAFSSGSPDQNNRSLIEHFSKGQISGEVYLDAVAAALPSNIGRQRLLAVVNADVKGLFPATVDVIADLATGYRLACYSNTHVLHWQQMLNSFSVFNHFERKMASFYAGAAKPDPAAFQYMITQLDCQPQDCLLIDDRRENIEAALTFGMAGHLCNDPSTLAPDLASLGITR